MISAVLKMKNFMKNIGKDLTKEQLLKLTHLGTSSPSTESVISSLDDKNETKKQADPLSLIDYDKFNHKKAPTLETHIRLNHDDRRNLQTDCPWCNRYYFDWLTERGLVTFVKEIEHKFDIDQLPQPGQPITPATEEKPHSTFRYFNDKPETNKEARTRKYHKEHTTEKWMESSAKALHEIREKTVVQMATYTEHNQFAKLPKSQDTAREWITGNCVYNPEELDPLPIDNNLFILPNPQYMRGPDLPKYLVMRFDNAIPKDIQHKLWTKWVELRKVLRRFEKSKNSRDKEPQAHFGMWRHYRAFVYLISDTSNQTPKALKLIEEFCTLLRDHIVPKMWSLLERYDPDTFRRHIIVRDEMAKNSTFVNKLFDYKHVDFAGVFYALAVKDGGSQKIHLDWMDHQGTYAWVINIGPGWEGGDLCLPQLGKRLPNRPGQIIAFQGRYLAHCAAPAIGDRLAMTCFTDRSLMGNALAAAAAALAATAEPSPFPAAVNKKRRSRNSETARKRAKRGGKNTKA